MKIDRLTPNAAILAELGQRLAGIRKQRRLSQETLAEQAGIGVATLRRIEDGKDGKLGSWLRILKALEMHGNLDVLLPADYRSPMAEAKRGRRARRGGDRDGDAPGFVWGDRKR